MAATRRDTDMTVYPIQAAVRSQSDGARAYTVTFPHCPCADFTNRRGQLIPVDEHTIGVTVCKHIAAAMERIGGWHRPAEPKVLEDLTHAAAKALLQGPLVGLTARMANSVLYEAADDYAGSEFTPEDGAVVDGKATYDKVRSRYTVTLAL